MNWRIGRIIKCEEGECMTTIDGKKINLARQMVASGVFMDKSQSPEGKGFKLAHHKKNPSAPLSPFYLNHRFMQSFPEAIDAANDAYWHMVSSLGLKFDLLAPIPEAAVPFISVLANKKRIPMVTPRIGKTHGSGATVDGKYQSGQHVLLFDDLITKSESKQIHATILEENGLIVRHILVLVDREQGGKQQLEALGYNLHAFFTVSELLDVFRLSGQMSAEMHKEIYGYLFPNT